MRFRPQSSAYGFGAVNVFVLERSGRVSGQGFRVKDFGMLVEICP